MNVAAQAIVPIAQEQDPRSLALMKAVGIDRLSVEQRELALNIAARYELDLLLKHLVMIEGRPYITRDGLLHIAHRSGQLDGIEVTDPTVVDGFWRCSASVYRKDMSRPFTYSGRYPTTGGNQKFAPEMATKVAEVMALRRAFDVAAPTLEERWDLEVPSEPPAKQPTLAERVAEKAAEVRANPDDDAAEQAIAEVTAPETEHAPPPNGLTYAAVTRLVKARKLDERPGRVSFLAALGEVVPARYDELALKETKDWDLDEDEWLGIAKQLELAPR